MLMLLVIQEWLILICICLCGKSPVNKGSCHGAELKFYFSRLHHSNSDVPNPTEEDFKLADIMRSSWT